MKASKKTPILVSLILLFAAMESRADFRIGPIHVMDQNGNPVSGATVTSESGALDGTTNANGDIYFHAPVKKTNTTTVIYLPPERYPDGTTNVDLKDREPAETHKTPEEARAEFLAQVYRQQQETLNFIKAMQNKSKK